MATISSLGVGSGLDLNGMVSKLVALERQPLQGLQSRASAIQTRISTFGQVGSQFAQLGDTVNALASSSGWNTQRASSADNAVVQAAVKGTGAPAQAGIHTVQVQQLATPQTLAGASMVASTALGGGSLVIDMGRYAADGSFVADASRSAVTVTISAAASTPADIAAAINAANAGASASTVTDATGTRIVLNSRASGEGNAFRVQVTADPGAGLASLAYPPDAGPPVVGMQRSRAAADAVALVNGVTVQSATNQLDHALPGLSLTLSRVSTSEVAITVSADGDARRKQVDDFVKAWNTVNKTLADALAYNETTRQAGPLQNDRVALAMQQALRSALRSSRSGGEFTRLSDAGLEVQRDGSLRVNEGKLGAALAQGSALGSLLHASGTAGVSDGIALRLKNLIAGFNSDGTGALANRNSALQAELKRNSDAQARVNDRADRIQKQLVKQYTALDASVSRLNALNGYVSQQITNWNRSNDN